VRRRVRSPQLPDRPRGHERGHHHPGGARAGQECRIVRVALATPDPFQMRRVDQHQVQRLVQRVVNRPPIIAGRLHHHELDPPFGQPGQQPAHLGRRRAEPFGLQRPRALPLWVRHPYTRQQKPLPQIQPSRPKIENFVDDILASHVRPFVNLPPELASPEESRKRKKLTLVLPAANPATMATNRSPRIDPHRQPCLRAHRHHRPSGLPD
jgi:hypothetical protein